MVPISKSNSRSSFPSFSELTCRTLYKKYQIKLLKIINLMGITYLHVPNVTNEQFISINTLNPVQNIRLVLL